MVDLHLHTTASDGRLSPRELVDRAAAAGITVMAVTDHDTTAALSAVGGAARDRGIAAVAGIEITAVADGRDVHVLGYFFEPDDADLARFLTLQRQRRVARVEAIAARLAALDVPIEVDALLAMARTQPGRSIGRPQVAAAMIAAGHARDTREAFDRWLGADGPAFVPREGPSIAQVIEALHRAGGLASLAHPGKTKIDRQIPALRELGLDALEVFHPDHDAGASDGYARTAADLGFLVTGGSDFHGDPSHGLEPGQRSLPRHLWERLRDAAPVHA